MAKPIVIEESHRLLDVHTLQGVQFGIRQSAFKRLERLSGFLFQPVKGEHQGLVWQYSDKSGRYHGQLLDVTALLMEECVTLPSDGTLYLSRVKGQSWGLLFHTLPQTLDLGVVKHKPVILEADESLPAQIPAAWVTQVIRRRWRHIYILDAQALIEQLMRWSAGKS